MRNCCIAQGNPFLCGGLMGREFKQGSLCIGVVDSLCSVEETNTTL